MKLISLAFLFMTSISMAASSADLHPMAAHPFDRFMGCYVNSDAFLTDRYEVCVSRNSSTEYSISAWGKAAVISNNVVGSGQYAEQACAFAKKCEIRFAISDGARLVDVEWAIWAEFESGKEEKISFLRIIQDKRKDSQTPDSIRISHFGVLADGINGGFDGIFYKK